MRARFLGRCVALVLLAWAIGAWAQTTDAPTAQRIATLKKQAANGDPKAQYRLAGHYLAGAGVPQNTNEALAWFRKAAEKGNAGSQYMLGQLYEDGGPCGPAVKQPDGYFQAGPVIADAAIPKNFTLAAKWYRKAAEQGYALAQNHLGTLFENGTGVPQNYSEAYFWLSLGTANGSSSFTDDSNDRDLAASHLTKAMLLQTQERARKWLEYYAANTHDADTPTGTSGSTVQNDAENHAESPPQKLAPAQVPNGTQIEGWAKVETDRIRSIVQTIKQCQPDIVSVKVGKHGKVTVTDTTGIPFNVTWDIAPSSSMRAPYVGYIEVVVGHHMDTDSTGTEYLEAQDYFNSQPALVNRYEFDLAPEGLQLHRKLKRNENEKGWVDDQERGWCWDRAVLSAEKAK